MRRCYHFFVNGPHCTSRKMFEVMEPRCLSLDDPDYVERVVFANKGDALEISRGLADAVVPVDDDKVWCPNPDSPKFDGYDFWVNNQFTYAEEETGVCKASGCVGGKVKLLHSEVDCEECGGTGRVS